MAILANERASQLSSSLGGKDSQGRNVNVSVTYNNKATISWEYSAGNDTSNRTYTTNSSKELGDQMAPGLTDKIGDTQNNCTQVNMAAQENMTFDSSGNPNFENKTTRATTSQNGTHEDGHVVGLRHETDTPANVLATEQKKDTNNIMNQSPQGNNITPNQRSQAIELIEKQQPKQ